MQRNGFSIVELSMAIAVVSFCLVALFGLLSVGLKNSETTFEQGAAAHLATFIYSDLAAVPRDEGENVSKRYKLIVPRPGDAASESEQTFYLNEDGVGKVGDPVSNESRYRVSVVLTPPAADNRTATTVRLAISWPALTDVASEWPAKFSGAFETVFAIDRN